MKIEIIKPYSYCPDGIKTVTAELGAADLDGRWANKAIASGHAKAPGKNKAKKPRMNKARK